MINLISSCITILSSALICFVVIYYSNSVMSYRHSRLMSNLGIIIGFCIYAVICLFSNTVLNVLSGIVIIFTTLYIGFEDSIGHIFFTTIILMALSMFGEWVAALILNLRIDSSFNMNVTHLEDLTFTLTSKLILYVSVVLLKHISVRRETTFKTQSVLYFLFLPISTMFLLSCFEKIRSEISAEHTVIMLSAALFVVVSNFIVYIVYDKMLDNIEKTNKLQELQHKENLDYESYELIKEKYDELRIMVHDFEKYCNNIEGMLSSHNGEAATFIAELKEKNKEFLLVEYTSSKALNILLSQKQQRCAANDIDFQVYLQDIDLSFIKETDIVSIFSNLLDNAIESCIKSSGKKLFLSLKVMNNSFIIIRADNSCDTEPTVISGALQTQKRDKNRHGIGMLSIKKSLTKYNGSMDWSYDPGNNMFSTMLMIKRPNLNNE